ncbi:MAG: hypothetical protein A2Y24_08395 [Clostridiales bacterium GWE2_32_10]|nr:MAG: hypothetical protein A2Y24_08395 [Clostridiales bacterium GWE2_32_10]
MNNINGLLDFYNEINKLKNTVRYNGADDIFKESTADHTWRLALMCIDLKEKNNIDIDITYAVKIALIHDMCEYQQNNDITIVDVIDGRVTKKDKKKLELDTMKVLAERYSRNDIFEIWMDYENQNSKESKYVKLLDRMESTLHIIDRLGKDNFISNLDAVATYCDKYIANFPELIPVLRGIKDKLKVKFIRIGIEWKMEYDMFDNL